MHSVAELYFDIIKESMIFQQDCIDLVVTYVKSKYYWYYITIWAEFLLTIQMNAENEHSTLK